MEYICMSGLDWSSAGLSDREPLSFPAERVKALDQALAAVGGVQGAVLLSTCNRTEVYLSLNREDLPDPGELLCRAAGLDPARYAPLWTHRTGDQALRHLMEVAGGLRSHIWGEDQIISQVKRAAALAREAGTADSRLETFFRCAATAGKELKSKLRLSGAAVSAAAAAVNWLESESGDSRKVMVIGNGEMGRICARSLAELGWSVTVTLRTYRHGETVVPYGCATVPYDERYGTMEGLDALVSATASPHYTVTAASFAGLRHPPRLVADLAVPRDVEPEIGTLPGVMLRDIDHLGGGTERTIPSEAKEIMEKYLLQWQQWDRYRSARPALERLKQAVTCRVLATAGDNPEDAALVELAVGKAVDLLSGGLKEHLDPEVLDQCAQKIRLHTREKGRSPETTAAPLRFPLFINLSGQSAVVIGGGSVACRRAEVLRRFGAEVTLIAPECPNRPEGVIWLPRRYENGDLAGAVLAVAATDDRRVNHQVGSDAAALGIPVSVADAPEECTFYFPAICTGEALVAGVVGDGTDHRRTARAAKAIRKALKELEP